MHHAKTYAGIVVALCLIGLSAEGLVTDLDADDDSTAAPDVDGVLFSDAQMRRMVGVVALQLLYSICRWPSADDKGVTKVEVTLFFAYFILQVAGTADEWPDVMPHAIGVLWGVWWLYVFGSRLWHRTPPSYNTTTTSTHQPRVRHVLLPQTRGTGAGLRCAALHRG